MEGNLSIFQKVDKIVQKGSNSEKSLLGFPLSEGKKNYSSEEESLVP